MSKGSIMNPRLGGANDTLRVYLLMMLKVLPDSSETKPVNDLTYKTTKAVLDQVFSKFEEELEKAEKCDIRG